MRSSCPQPMAFPLCIFRAAGGGRGKYGKRNRNQIQWAGPVSICRAGPAYSCGFDNKMIIGRRDPMISGETSALKLSEPYKKNIGRVTFQVSSFGNSQGENTAQQLILKMLEAKVKQEKHNNRL